MSDVERLRTAMTRLWEAMRVLQASDSTALTDVAIKVGGCYETLDAVFFGPLEYEEEDNGVITSRIPY
jgi:hypothetical protein